MGTLVTMRTAQDPKLYSIKWVLAEDRIGIMRDVMKITDQGKSLKAMPARIEKTYSNTTPTPPVPWRAQTRFSMGWFVVEFWVNPLIAFGLSEAQLISLLLMVLWVSLIMQSAASKLALKKQNERGMVS